MSKQKLTIFCNVTLSDAATALLAKETSEHRLLTGQDDCLAADVAFGQPEPEQIIASSRLRWVHITSAGYTRYDTDAMRTALHNRGAVFTNSSHVYDAPCAQHVLAMMMADARQLLPCHDDQRTDHSWHSGERRAASYLLNGQTVLFLGLGAIAQDLIRLLQPFDMNVIGVRRSGKPQPGIEVVGEEALDDVLARADHVINVLPESDSTHGFMDAERFGHMKAGAKFYNIGRGKTVNQDALLAALNAGQLGAAYLDVTDPEPLPPEHPLWTAPNCYITPHSGGGHAGEQQRLVEHFVRNLRAFEDGKPLADVVWGDSQS